MRQRGGPVGEQVFQGKEDKFKIGVHRIESGRADLLPGILDKKGRKHGRREG